MPDHIKAHAPWSEADVIVPAAVWLASRDSEGVTGKRLAGTEFNRILPEDLDSILQDA